MGQSSINSSINGGFFIHPCLIIRRYLAWDGMPGARTIIAVGHCLGVEPILTLLELHPVGIKPKIRV